jgi:ABC-type oligopeptide transport system substrate-binding subunit
MDATIYFKGIILYFFLFLVLYQTLVFFRFITIQEGLETTTEDTTDNSNTNTDTNTNTNTTDTINSYNYQEYDWDNLPEDSMELAQQNAKNIAYLKNALDKSSDQILLQRMTDLSGNMDTLTQQMQDMVDAQKSYAEDNLPSDPVEISGT